MRLSTLHITCSVIRTTQQLGTAKLYQIIMIYNNIVAYFRRWEGLALIPDAEMKVCRSFSATEGMHIYDMIAESVEHY